MSFFSSFDKSKTFKPTKDHKKDTKRHELHKYAQKTLGSGDMKASVVLPAGEDRNEWLAMNVVDFFNEVNMVYGSIATKCTNESCPVMCAGSKFEYLWADTATKKAIKVNATEYVDRLMTWIEFQLNNEDIFPTSVDTPFPKDFEKNIKQMFKRLFRVYAHVYYNHFTHITEMGAEAHLNTCFKHFIYFTNEFELIDKEELVPLNEVIANLTKGK